MTEKPVRLSSTEPPSPIFQAPYTTRGSLRPPEFLYKRGLYGSPPLLGTPVDDPRALARSHAHFERGLAVAHAGARLDRGEENFGEVLFYDVG
jgi:hypothetical protein